jgi:hypothetical protein
VSDNPFAPGYSSYPAPRRRSWPSWLVVVAGVLSGVVLAAGSTAGVVLIATSDTSPSSGSGSSSSGPIPLPGASPRSGQSPDGTARIDFPDGSTGTFAVPSGLHHDTADDDDGHVALAADDDSAAYLDLYTDETTASQARDLHLAATQDATDDRNHGNKTGAITYRTVGGRAAAQYRFSHQDGSSTFDALVTVVLVGNEQISLYWSDDADDFNAGTAQRSSAAVLTSLHVSGGDPGSDT